MATPLGTIGTNELASDYHKLYRSAKEYVTIFKKSTNSHNFGSPYHTFVEAYEAYHEQANKKLSNNNAKAIQEQKFLEMENIMKIISKSKQFSYSEGHGKHKRDITTFDQILEEFDRKDQQSIKSWDQKLHNKHAVEIELNEGGSGLYISGGFNAQLAGLRELQAQQRDWFTLVMISFIQLYHYLSSVDRQFNSATQEFIKNWNADKDNIGKDFELFFDPEKKGSMICARSKKDQSKFMKLSEVMPTPDLIENLNAHYKKAGLSHTVTLKGHSNENEMEFGKGNEMEFGKGNEMEFGKGNEMEFSQALEAKSKSKEEAENNIIFTNPEKGPAVPQPGKKVVAAPGSTLRPDKSLDTPTPETSNPTPGAA